MIKKKIYYWSPYLTEIATTKAVINSAYSVNKYSKTTEALIINAAGEFDNKKKELDQKGISILNLHHFNYTKLLPKYGKIASRISYLIIFAMSFLKLKNILMKNNPDYVVIHLITSLPILLFNLFNFKTKCILRISGYPHLNFLRMFFWKNFLNKVDMVTCPTISTYNYIKQLNIISDDKLFFLPDPVINIKEINQLKREKVKIEFKEYFIGIGRLTKQKNFEFLINAFKEIVKISPQKKLLIFGNGEERDKLNKKIIKMSLQDKVKIFPYNDNIFPYLKNAECFILSSLWEDPGFVLLESSFCKTLVISSDCKNGPEEILKKNNAGIIYKTSNLMDFIKKYHLYLSLNIDEINKIKRNALLSSRTFTIFNHYLKLNEMLKLR